MKNLKIIQILMAGFFSFGIVLAQSTFSVDEYTTYLNETANMTYEQLSQNYSAGYFKSGAASDINSVQYLDSVDLVYELTEYEKELLQKNSFMVSERLSPQSFITGFRQVYDNDLPVYISTDAILHTIHLSYDAILQDFERTLLIPKITELLTLLHQQISVLESRYASNAEIKIMLEDIDVYLTVPRIIFDENSTPYFAKNTSVVNELTRLIEAQQPAKYALFASKKRTIDFSQFIPRGHYTDEEIFQQYFKAMMWLGRIELYLTAPKSDDPDKPTKQDIQRQLINSILISEAVKTAKATNLYNEIEKILLYFIGESDNVTLTQIFDVAGSYGLKNAATLLDTAKVDSFQTYLVESVGTSQKILSHILMSDPQSPDQIEPATAFLLFGQRFVIDSYVMGNVVYDRIIYNGNKIKRMLPSSLDVLFALGNDAALQLLSDEMTRYPYASNLISNRYLIDAYDSDYWQSSLYNSWLQSIRTLSPKKDRDHLPAFMQSAAWWHKQINTQLSSWAQLRHDNLLYAKQSYSGAVTCFYPEAFVEPIPEFYSSVSSFVKTASKITDFIPDDNVYYKTLLTEYFNSVSSTMDTLLAISFKELQGVIPNEEEKQFLKRMLFVENMCGTQYTGWYPKLYWLHWTDSPIIDQPELIVADVHTAPTDESGAPVGWVLHAGTGPINMAIVLSDLPTRENMAFTGPVMSYYEHVSTNFKRLTDKEWETVYNQEPSFRPDFVNLYLADKSGNSRGEGRTLLTGLQDNEKNPWSPKSLILVQNYPNPFNGSTVIAFSIPNTLSHKTADLTIFDIQGRVVKNLLNEELPAGNYATRWDGLTNKNLPAASGLYFYRLKIGSRLKTGKMLLTK